MLASPRATCAAPSTTGGAPNWQPPSKFNTRMPPPRGAPCFPRKALQPPALADIRRHKACKAAQAAGDSPGAAARSTASGQSTDLATAKRVLKRACYLTDRGAGSSVEARGVIEEAQVAVESLGGAVDFAMLEGKWRLIYTSAFDVTGIIDLGRGTMVKVGGIYQRYSNPEEGKVENIVEFGLPPFLQADKGLTFTVEAKWGVRSPQRIALNFQKAGVGGLKITPELEALIAPALLPRNTLQMALLQGLQEFVFSVPLVTRPPIQANGRPSSSPSFQISYLDDDTFIGRAAQGSFIFLKDKEQPGV